MASGDAPMQDIELDVMSSAVSADSSSIKSRTPARAAGSCCACGGSGQPLTHRERVGLLVIGGTLALAVSITLAVSLAVPTVDLLAERTRGAMPGASPLEASFSGLFELLHGDRRVGVYRQACMQVDAESEMEIRCNVSAAAAFDADGALLDFVHDSDGSGQPTRFAVVVRTDGMPAFSFSGTTSALTAIPRATQLLFRSLPEQQDERLDVAFSVSEQEQTGTLQAVCVHIAVRSGATDVAQNAAASGEVPTAALAECARRLSDSEVVELRSEVARVRARAASRSLVPVALPPRASSAWLADAESRATNVVDLAAGALGQAWVRVLAVSKFPQITRGGTLFNRDEDLGLLGRLTLRLSDLQVGVSTLPTVLGRVHRVPRNVLDLYANGMQVKLAMTWRNSGCLSGISAAAQLFAHHRMCIGIIFGQWCYVDQRIEKRVQMGFVPHVEAIVTIKPSIDGSATVTFERESATAELIDFEHNLSMNAQQIQSAMNLLLAPLGGLFRIVGFLFDIIYNIVSRNTFAAFIASVPTEAERAATSEFRNMLPAPIRIPFAGALLTAAQLLVGSSPESREATLFLLELQKVGSAIVAITPPRSPIACSGRGPVATLNDVCVEDWGVNAVGDNMEFYCVDNILRACLSGEMCPWRSGGTCSQLFSASTCSAAGLYSERMAVARCQSVRREQRCQSFFFFRHCWDIEIPVDPPRGSVFYRSSPTTYLCRSGQLVLSG